MDIVFPPWSDLSTVSNQTRSGWEGEIALRTRFRKYFDGEVFRDRVRMSGETIGDYNDMPLLYPLGLNMVKMICLAQTDALFGEWKDGIISFETKPDLVTGSDHERASGILNDILAHSNGNSMLWEIALDRNVYGGAVIKVSPSLVDKGHIKWTRIPLEAFFPVWDPDDPNILLECWVVVTMTGEQAKAKYGIGEGGPQIVTRVEHWTKTLYENILNGTRIDAYSGANPWGFVPYVYIPHYRSTHFWGISLTEDLIPIQDELNAVLADAGEAINYNSHPVRWGINLPRAFNAKNFPLSPNAMWDLGRQMPGGDKPEIGILEANHPVSAETFQYIDFLYDWGRTTSFTPPVALGADEGGSQRSGQTLQIRMIPLLRANRRSRSYMGNGIQRIITMTGMILKQKNFPDIPSRAIEKMLTMEIVPHFAELLPMDHQAIVDEVVKLLSTEPQGISIDTAQKILGRGSGEVSRIKQDMKDKELLSEQEKADIQASKGKADAQAGQQGRKVLEGMQGKMHPQGNPE